MNTYKIIKSTAQFRSEIEARILMNTIESDSYPEVISDFISAEQAFNEFQSKGYKSSIFKFKETVVVYETEIYYILCENKIDTDILYIAGIEV